MGYAGGGARDCGPRCGSHPDGILRGTDCSVCSRAFWAKRAPVYPRNFDSSTTSCLGGGSRRFGMLLPTVTGALLPRNFTEPAGTLSCRLRCNFSPSFRTRPVMNLIEVCSRLFRILALSQAGRAGTAKSSTLTVKLDDSGAPPLHSPSMLALRSSYPVPRGPQADRRNAGEFGTQPLP